MTATIEPLTAPFPWFGGKRRVASIVWKRLGDVANYVEPFAGSLAVILGRPTAPRIETVNDVDNYIVNFWRAVASASDEVAEYADWPVNEADLHARHRWLVEQPDWHRRMEGDPHHYDAKIAGWWVWGICLLDRRRDGAKLRTSAARNWVELEVFTPGRWRESTKRPVLVDRGSTASERVSESVCATCPARLRNVRTCCGDWARVCTPAVTTGVGLTGVFLDPPYSADRDGVYNHDSYTVAHDVRRWCIEVGDNPQLRIALCGYEGEHNELEGLGWGQVRVDGERRVRQPLRQRQPRDGKDLVLAALSAAGRRKRDAVFDGERRCMKISLSAALLVLFIALKLTGNIDWSWWWVLSPHGFCWRCAW